ncbi:hypothetical protein [Amycolatopsis sp. NPDC051102]|uniref:hypothetical protein n=1 Tax=Amycolatopsis sp. NPDC051102 TaxID=3155163 RepID=UPI0034128041
MQELRTVARAAPLESYETPRDVLIETEPFTVENGLLSDTRKILRSRLQERYVDRLERLYDKRDYDRNEHLRELRALGKTTGPSRRCTEHRGASQ